MNESCLEEGFANGDVRGGFMFDSTPAIIAFSPFLSLSLSLSLEKVAKSGEVGLAMLNSNPTAFDLVLLDVVMPGLDGLQVVRGFVCPCCCSV